MEKGNRLPTFEGFNESENIDENYGDELNKLISTYKKVENNMKGSSVSSKDIWLDLGIKLGHISEKDSEKILKDYLA